MAEDDQDKANAEAAEREAEIDSELDRIGKNPDQVDAGSENLGTQSAPSGTPHGGEDQGRRPDDAASSQEEAQELPNEQQAEQWAHSGGDEELSEEALDEDDEDSN